MRKRATMLAAQRGFTLIELMVVIGIIGLISSIVAINVLAAREKANVQKARADVKQLADAMKMYSLEHGGYPSALEELVDGPRPLVDNGRQALLDPWRRPYLFAQPGENGRPYSIWSYGADGLPGGDHENADIFAP
jgi:general secretion pathway protein G